MAEYERRDPRPEQVALDELWRRGAQVVRYALEEDLGQGDPASHAAIDPRQRSIAWVRAKERGVVAGIPVARSVFHQVDPRIETTPLVADGAVVEPGEAILRVEGPLHSLLMAERTALNFLQRMSGIATTTAQCVDAVATAEAVILDTRKTAPGLRALDKYAVRIGGGSNHRVNLADMAMLKDNHIDGCGGIAAAAQAVRARYPNLPIEIEVRDLEELDECLALDPLPERVLLDNETCDELRASIRRAAGRVSLEASGGIEPHRLAEVARTGVDAVSLGYLTHSSKALDLSMTLVQPEDGAMLRDRIASIRSSLGMDVAILAHHYVRDEVAEHADRVGDSVELARASLELEAETIVLCGVRFMAETAALLVRDDQRVVSVIDAGCFLADCAAVAEVEAVLSDRAGVLPVVYANSSIGMKAMCGARGGIVCTSANAAEAIAWALERAERVLFVPDQHLGANAARSLGLEAGEMGLLPPDGEPRDVDDRRLLLWPGACNTHRRIRWWDVERIRDQHPDVRVIVHPECSTEVVACADSVGSTRQIIDAVASADDGTTIAIGTDARLVARLRRTYSNKTILDLAEVPPMCSTMGQATAARLLDVLKRLASDRAVPEVSIPPEDARHARLALERMLSLRLPR